MGKDKEGHLTSGFGKMLQKVEDRNDDICRKNDPARDLATELEKVMSAGGEQHFEKAAAEGRNVYFLREGVTVMRTPDGVDHELPPELDI